MTVTAERRLLLDELEHPTAWPDAAEALLAGLGFRLLEPERTGGGGHLLIALRSRPTLRHFDPEVVAYYAPHHGGATLATICRSTRLPDLLERPLLWGQVHVLDRIPVENRFLTFGGDLRLAAVGPDLTAIDLRSPGPIVRWGGHSQGTDLLTDAVGAFFGRLIVRVDFVAGAERRIDRTPPGVLYRAFLADRRARARSAAQHGAVASELDGWIDAAWARSLAADPTACAAAENLLRELDLEAEVRPTL